MRKYINIIESSENHMVTTNDGKTYDLRQCDDQTRFVQYKGQNIFLILDLGILPCEQAQIQAVLDKPRVVFKGLIDRNVIPHKQVIVNAIMDVPSLINYISKEISQGLIVIDEEMQMKFLDCIVNSNIFHFLFENNVEIFDEVLVGIVEKIPSSFLDYLEKYKSLSINVQRIVSQRYPYFLLTNMCAYNIPVSVMIQMTALRSIMSMTNKTRVNYNASGLLKIDNITKLLDPRVIKQLEDLVNE